MTHKLSVFNQYNNEVRTEDWKVYEQSNKKKQYLDKGDIRFKFCLPLIQKVICFNWHSISVLEFNKFIITTYIF